MPLDIAAVILRLRPRAKLHEIARLHRRLFTVSPPGRRDPALQFEAQHAAVARLLNGAKPTVYEFTDSGGAINGGQTR